MHIETLGYIAAFLTTAAFFPQTIKTIKSRDTASISLAMYVMFTTGIALWLGYAFLIESMPMIIANIITFVLSATILVLKLSEKKTTTQQ
jgi:MtN3 and saliva related transmembrane protein